MKKFYLFLLLISCATFAQTPYELFNSKSEFFFDGVYNSAGYTLRGLRTDSVIQLSGDSIYYHYRIYKNLGSCRKSNYPSWLGYKTIRKVNEDYLFFNKTNDTILIKAGAQVGASWIYYKFSSGNYLKATVTSKIFSATYNGLNDTVKIISFQCYNSSNNPIYHYYNTKSIRIARNQGLINTGCFYDFPNDTTFIKRSYGKHLTRKDVYDNAVGDIIQIANFYSNNSPPPNNFYNISYVTDTVASKIYVTADSVHITNTLGQIRRHGQLNKYAVTQMPQQALIKNWPLSFSEIREVNYRIDTAGSCQKTVIYFLTDYCNYITTAPTDTCYGGASVSCTNYGRFEYHDGAGTIIDELFMGIGIPRTGRKINFTKLNNVMCGAFYALSINEVGNAAKIKIYPNPSSDFIRISGETGKVYQVIITNLTGIEVFKDYITYNGEIDIRGLYSGVYFIQLTEEKTIYNFKLIKP